MFILAPEEVVTQSAAVNDVLGLLGDVRLVGLKIELVAAAAELVGGVILQVDAAEMRGTVVARKPKVFMFSLPSSEKPSPSRSYGLRLR